MGYKKMLNRCATFLRSAYLHERSLRVLQPLFPPSSPFWHYLETYHLEFAQAVFLEATKHVERISPYSEEERRQIAVGKSIPTIHSSRLKPRLSNIQSDRCPTVPQ